MYEIIRSSIERLPIPGSESERQVHWLDDERVVGVSRTMAGRMELFVAGAKLTAKKRQVSDVLEFGPWWHDTTVHQAFTANRIILPAGAQFEQVAALLCTELLRNGINADAQEAFNRTESLIALTVERLRLSDSALLGLVGELLLLEALCRKVSLNELEAVILAWNGWRQSLRDFGFNRLGVEVKTTLGQSSTHHITGPHQVQPMVDSSASSYETALALLSVGLVEATGSENSFSLPSLVEGITTTLVRAKREDLASLLISRIREYGSASGFGYDHNTMSSETAFGQLFGINFLRYYDMTDTEIKVLRPPDLDDFVHLERSSVSYVLRLPEHVTGNLNPRVGLSVAVQTVLQHIYS